MEVAQGFARTAGHRFTQVTSDDHSAWIWLPTLLALSYSSCFLAFRLFIKRHRYGADDAMLWLSYVFAFTHWILSILTLSNGIGKSVRIISPSEIRRIAKLIYASRLLFIIAMALAKCSVVLLIRQVFTREFNHAWKTCNTLICIHAGLGLATALLMSIKCFGITKQETIFDQGHSCPHLEARLIALAIIDAISELSTVFTLLILLLPVRLKRSSKILVLTAFSFRLPNIFFSAMTTTTLITEVKESDPSMTMAVPIAWLESYLAYNLISATIPCLKSFMGSFQTGGLGFTASSLYAGAHSSGTGQLTKSSGTARNRETPAEAIVLQDMGASVSSPRPTSENRRNSVWGAEVLDAISLVQPPRDG